MRAALLLVIAGGVAIGLATPVAQVAQAPAAPAVAKREVRKPTLSAPGPAPAARWGGETRLARGSDGHFYATAQINGQPIELVVDTGASLVALTVEDARRAGIAVDPARFDVIGRGASGDVRGHEIVIPRIMLGGREARNLAGVVLEGSEMSLLGQNFLSRFGEVRMSGDEMVLR